MPTQWETKADWVMNVLCWHSIPRNEWLSHAGRRTSLVWTIFNCTKTGTKFGWKKSLKTESYSFGTTLSIMTLFREYVEVFKHIEFSLNHFSISPLILSGPGYLLLFIFLKHLILPLHSIHSSPLLHLVALLLFPLNYLYILICVFEGVLILPHYI